MLQNQAKEEGIGYKMTNCDKQNPGKALWCDLHTHSVFSDGTYTPRELVTEAKRLGLIIALTDHNTVAGLPEFLSEAEKQGVTAVPGIEFSTDYQGKELHLVGLFVQEKHYPTVDRMVKEQHLLKEINNMELVEKLNQAGYMIEYQNVKRRNPSGNANRAHIAAELLECGYVSSIKEAFDTILRDDGGFYSPPARLQLTEVIQILHDIGVMPILAHPLQELTEKELREMLPELKKAGLVGIETVHSSYDEETLRLARELASEYVLLPSGGSDFHGTVKPGVLLGTGRGESFIPQDMYCTLREKWENRNRSSELL